MLTDRNAIGDSNLSIYIATLTFAGAVSYQWTACMIHCSESRVEAFILCMLIHPRRNRFAIVRDCIVTMKSSAPDELCVAIKLWDQ